MKKLLMFAIALLMVPIAYAAADITYTFDQNNVSSLIFNCLDTNCDSVGTFSGSIIKGPNATDGKVTFRYPDTLATSYGYVEYFYSKGYRPLIGKHNWHTYGQTGIATASESNTFTKMPNTCRATVSQLSFVNQLEPNKPLVVQTNAKLDSSTSSAFQLIQTGFVPPQYKQEYYGADTIVKMEILNGSTPIHTQQQNFTAANGNSIFAGSTVPVSFSYIPQAEGNFTVKVTSTVIDDQCASKEDQSAQGTFSVLTASPTGQFYSIVNGVTVDKMYPKAGETVTVSFNKITNHVFSNGTTTAVQSDFDYLVTLGTTTVFSKTIKNVFANPDTTTPVTYSFTFTPTTAGVHTIKVKVYANSVLPTSKPETKAEQTIQLEVKPTTQSYKVAFNVLNGLNGTKVQGANVTLIGIGTQFTDANGTTVFNGVPEGVWLYKATANGYSSASNNLNVKTDLTQSIVLHTTINGTALNTVPILNLPPTLSFVTGTNGTLNLNDYVHDDQDADTSLIWTVTGNTSMQVNVAQGIATFVPNTGFSGTNTITFTVNDTGNLTATDTMTVTVTSSNNAPTFSAFPTITTIEDSAVIRALNLQTLTTDLDTPANQLVYAINATSNSSLFTAQIDEGKYLSIVPRPNAFGTGTVTVSVTDGTSIALGTATVTITPVNDAPVVISIPTIPPFNESTNFTFNLSQVFLDVDGDNLTFGVTPTQNVTFVINTTAPSMTIIPQFNVFGTRTFNVTATDTSGLRATATFTIQLNFVDDKPYFNMVIPNVTTFEEINNSLDLTPFENDPEDGPDANNNQLTWKMQFANQTNLTPVTLLSNSLFDATITTATDFLLIAPKVNQSGSVTITLYLFDSAGNNQSQNITINVINLNDAPVFTNLANQSANVGSVFYYDINATDSDQTNDTLTFSTNSTIFTINSATGEINFTPTNIGTFPTLVTVCDNNNACTNGTFTLTITDISAPTFSGEITPPNPSTYSPGANYTFSINWTDNVNVTNVTFQFNNVNITNVSQSGSQYTASVSNLAAGNYTYKWYATDSSGNMNMTNASVFTVNKAQSSMSLLLDGSASNTSVAQGATVNILANITNTTSTITITENGNQISTGTSPLSINKTYNTAGGFNITATFAGNQNYTGSNATLVIAVNDTTAPVFGILTSSPTSPAAFGSTYRFTASVTDNVAVSTVTFEFDGTNTTATQVGATSVYEVNISSLSAGNHTFRWFANDTAGNTNSTTAANYTVLQGTPSLTLTLNGIAGNTSVQVGSNITIVGNVTNPTGGQVELYVNGTLSQNSTSPVTFTTSFASTGTVPITAVFPGNTNFTNSSITRFLTITPIVTAMNILPPNGTALNYSTFLMTADTPATTTCGWSLSDVAQSSMANFSTANGLNHTANITGYTLGLFNVSVACNGQTAATNTDLTYLSQNILDGSTLVGTNNINNTIMTGSLINASTLTNVTGINNTLHSVTATLSVINNSVLRNCTVTNSTVKSITATNCTFTNSFVDPSDLTGSTITGNSVIIASNVTFSNVDNSTIMNSNVQFSTIANSTIDLSTIINSTISNSYINQSTITNSNVNNSTITNSVISNAIVNGATISNNQISSGTITVGNFTYNASSSGTANLSQVIPVPPVASFTPASTTVAPNAVISFTSTTTDANVGGPLNDSVTLFWNFGDGTNSTNSTPTKSYNSTGVYSVTLTATDSFGLTNTATGTINVQVTPPPAPSSGGSGGGGGGGGGSGGGGGAPRIALTEVPVIRSLFVGQPLQFTIDGKLQPLSILLRRASQTDDTTEWMLNGISYVVKKGETKTFDISKDGVPDLALKVIEVARTAATISVQRAGTEATSVPPLPNFNFKPREPSVENQPPQVVGEDETTVDVNADVKPSIFSKLAEKLRGLFSVEISPSGSAAKIGVVLFVVLVGAIAYSIFVRWE